MTDTTVPATDQDRRRKRGVFVRFGLATVAVVGIGAAITTAAWTDDVWFNADAQAASFNLQGSTSATGPWSEYDTQAGALVVPIPASNFGSLIPGETRTLVVHVKNASTVQATNLTATATGNGTLFGAGTTAAATVAVADATLAVDQVTAVTVTLKTGELPASFQGTTGTVLVKVNGSSS